MSNSITISVDVEINTEQFNELWDSLDESDQLSYFTESDWTPHAIRQIQEHLIQDYFEFTADELDELTRILLETRSCSVTDTIYHKVQSLREYAK